MKAKGGPLYMIYCYIVAEKSFIIHTAGKKGIGAWLHPRHVPI